MTTGFIKGLQHFSSGRVMAADIVNRSRSPRPAFRLCCLLSLICLVHFLVPQYGDDFELTASQASEADTASFSDIVQLIARESADHIRVDPRPLRPDPDIGPFVRPEHLAQVDSAVVEARAAELKRLGIEQFRLGTADHCGSGPGGTPPAVEPGDSTTMRDWLSRPVLPTCVLLSLPRPGGVHYPPAKIDTRHADHGPNLWTVRVVTIGRGQATDVLDVVVRRGAGQIWRVVEIARLDALRS